MVISGSVRRATCAIQAHPTLQRDEFHHLIWGKDWLGQAGAEQNASRQSLADQGIVPVWACALLEPAGSGLRVWVEKSGAHRDESATLRTSCS